MSTLKLTYDGDQHGTAVKEPEHKSVEIGCIQHGVKSDELSAGDLVGLGVAGCMLFSMGHQADAEGLDLRGTVVDVKFSISKQHPQYMDSITLVFAMPKGISQADRAKLEAAAERCPLKTSFRPETKISYEYTYYEDMAPAD